MTQTVLDPDTDTEAQRLAALHEGLRTEADYFFAKPATNSNSLRAKHYRFICGVDPGAKGAIAIFDRDTGKLSLFDMPCAAMDVGKGKQATNRRITSGVKLGALFREHEIDVVWLEDVSARPGQGVSSMFSFGRAVGVVEGVAGGLGIPVIHVRPQVWMKTFAVVGKSHIHGGGPGRVPTSRVGAASAFPEHAALFARVKDDGRADAALIALHGAKHADGAVVSKYRGESLALE